MAVLFEYLSDRINRLIEKLLLLLGTLICLILFAQVLCRYAGSSLGWSEEVSRFLLVAITFFGGSAAYRRADFIGLEGIGRQLGPRAAIIIRRLIQLLTLIFFLLIAWFGSLYVVTAWQHRSAALGLPMGLPYAVIPLAALVFIIHILADLSRKTGEPRP